MNHTLNPNIKEIPIKAAKDRKTINQSYKALILHKNYSNKRKKWHRTFQGLENNSRVRRRKNLVKPKQISSKETRNPK